MTPEFADAFFPSGHSRLVAYGGMTHEQAFDWLAATAATPAFQQMIAEFASTPAGRALLQQTRGYWDAEGLPCPWDNVLELTHEREGEGMKCVPDKTALTLDDFTQAAGGSELGVRASPPPINQQTSRRAQHPQGLCRVYLEALGQHHLSSSRQQTLCGLATSTNDVTKDGPVACSECRQIAELLTDGVE